MGKSNKNHSKMEVESLAVEEDELASTGIFAHTSDDDNSKKRKKKKKNKAEEEEANEAEDCEGKKRKRRKRDNKAGGDGGEIEEKEEPPQPELHVGLFGELTSVDSETREGAALSLVKELMQVQKAYLDNGSRDSSSELGNARLDSAKLDYLNSCAPTVRYALRRLIRGISSSRACARQGFALGFASVISVIPAIEVKALLNLIKELLEVTSSMKGQEIRESLLGRLFAYGAIIRSGKVSERMPSDNTVECEVVGELCQCLLSLAEKKTFLREPAVNIIVELIEKMSKNTISNPKVANFLLDWLQKGPESGNPDVLLLSLKLYRKLPLEMKSLCKMLPQSGNLGDIFTTDNLSYLVPVLKETTCCHPRIHSLWQVLVDILLSESGVVGDDAVSLQPVKKSKKNKKHNTPEKNFAKKLCSFWRIIVEESLLSSSHDRKHLAINVFLMIFPRVPVSCIEILLSYKFVQCLIDILPVRDSHLFKTAQHCLQEIFNITTDNDERRASVIAALQINSNGGFDNKSKTNTVKKMMGSFNTKSGCLLLIQKLIGLFLEGNRIRTSEAVISDVTDSKGGFLVSDAMPKFQEKKSCTEADEPSDVMRSWIIDSLYHISKKDIPDPASRLSFQKEILKFLAIQGLFTSTLSTEVTSFELRLKMKWPKRPASTYVRKLSIEKMQQVLADAQLLLNSHKDIDLNEKTSQETNDLGAYMMGFLGTLQNIPSLSLFWSLNKEDEEIFSKLHDAETQLFQSCDKENLNFSKIQAMRYLLIQLLLQIPLRPGEVSEASSELLICCNKAFGNVLKIPEPCIDSEDEPALIDVLLDALLSLLPQSPTPIRIAVEQVFKCFCESITDIGITNMLRIITKDLKPVRRTHLIVEESDEDDLIDIEEDASGDQLEESEDNDDDDVGNANEILDQDSKIKSDYADIGDFPSSDSDLDDDAMFRLDVHLAQILKDKKKTAGGSENAHLQLTNFKLRVLSLLEYFLNKHSDRAIVLKIFKYFMQAYVNCRLNEGHRELAKRIDVLIHRKICDGKDYPKGPEVELSNLESLLRTILKLACRSKDSNVEALSQRCVYWLLKVMHGNFNKTELKKVTELFSPVIEDFFNSRKCRIKAGCIREIIKRHNWLGVQLFGMLVNKCLSARSDFLQLEGLTFLEEIIRPWVNKSTSAKDDLQNLRFLEEHLSSLSELIQCLVLKPSKKSSRGPIRRFCLKVLKTFSLLKLEKSFAKLLRPDCYPSFESHLGKEFHPFRRLIKS